jgi:predicted permease
MIDTIRQDLSYALRTIRRNASFAALVIGGLALGIGANAAIYSVVDAVLIRKLPVARPDELIALGLTENVDAAGSGTPGAVMYSYPLYRDVRDANTAFTGLLATGSAGRLQVRIDSAAIEPEHPRGRFVSGNYFSLLGVHASLGRTLGPADDASDAPPRATISYAYWASRFHKDSSMIGSSLVIDDARVTIVGVAAPGFDGEIVGSSTDLWLPIGAHDQLESHRRVLDDRTAMWLLLIGRLKPGLTLEQARRRVEPVIKASIFNAATPQQRRRLERRPLEIPISTAARGLSRVRFQFAAALGVLMIGVAILLCIVCVNVANLLLARGVARRREMAMRLALGASRARIVRQLLTESLVLALASGVVGVIVAWWTSKLLVVLAAGGSPLVLDVDPNPRVLAFTMALAVSSVLLFGLVPSLRSSRIELATTTRAGRGSVTTGARFGLSLVAAQVALSLILLSGAVALMRGLSGALRTDLGFDRDHVLVAKLDIAKPGYSGARLAQSVDALRDRVAALPGVSSVTLSENGLFDGTEWSSSIDVPGSPPRMSPDDSVASTDAVGAGYASGIGARLLAGRDLTRQDEGDHGNAQAVLVNATFANFYFPGQSALGRTIHFGPRTTVNIVGVVADVRGQSLDAPDGHHARRVYYPYLHGDDTTRFGQPTELRLLMRTAGAPASVLASVRRAIATTDPALPIESLDPLLSLVRGSIREERLVMQITTAISALAIALAAIGLFGVMSYWVARRTNEIGVRVALGARGADIARMIVAQALRPIALGLVVGIPLGLVSMRLLHVHLTAVSPDDPVAIAMAVAVLTLCGVAAALLPAHRASRIDPIQALRQE